MRRYLLGFLISLALVASVGLDAQVGSRWPKGRGSAVGQQGASPTVIINSPDAGPTFLTAEGAQTISGTASGAGGFSLAWTCPECLVTSGTPTGTTSWTFNVTLGCSTSPGTANVITVTVVSTGVSDVLTATCLTPDGTAPEVTVTSPTSSPTYATSTQAYSPSGTATDAVGISSCTITCATCTPASRTTTVSGTTSATWAATSSINLASGANTVVTTCQDAATNQGTDTTTVTYTASDLTDPVVTITSNCGGGAGADCTVASLPQTISGTCTDNVACTSVTASCTNASPASPSVSGTSAWSFSLAGITSGDAAACTVTALDQAGNDATDAQTVTYVADLQILTTTLSALIEDQSGQSRCVTASGGVPPYTWDISAGALPTGMTLTGSTSTTECFTGTPTTAQTVNPTFRITDSAGSPDSDTQAISVTVNAPGSETAHDYFDTLKALPEVLSVAACASTVPGDNGACSLRNQAQLDAMANQSPSTSVTYTSGDYATVTVDTNEVDIPSNKQLYASTGTLSTGDVLFIWDARFGVSMLRPECGGENSTGTYKTFQIRAGSSGNGSIYFEQRNNWQDSGKGAAIADCTDVSAVDVRVYPAEGGAGWPAGMTADVGYTPTGQGALADGQFTTKVNVTTRYVALVESHVAFDNAIFNPWESATGATLAASSDTDGDGTWNALSLWICDETRDCQRILFRVPWKNENFNNASERDVRSFNVEFNTSTNTRTGGPMTSEIRNLVILRNYALDLSGANSAADVTNNPNIFKKPIP